MSLDNNSANNFKDFLDAIKPYLNYQLYDMSGMGVEAFRFNTDEKPVGQWTDRKILYQKVFTNRTMPSANGLIANTVVADLEKAIKTTIIATGGNQIIINPSLGQNIITYYKGTSGIWVDYTNNPSWVYGSTVDIIIQYTKTTDSPLSSDEKFAGVTSGGEIVYEKTIDCGALPNNSVKNVPHNITGTVIGIEGVGISSSGTIPIPFMWTDSLSSVVTAYVDGSNITIGTGMNRSAYNATIKLRYTKSS